MAWDCGATFSADDTRALGRNGWRVGISVATRTYRGGVRSKIWSDGRWRVLSGPMVRLWGRERDAICAAMEANEQAWAQPEYRAANQT